MSNAEPNKLDGAISRCRQAYAAFQQLASCTDEALYQALGHVYTVRFQVRSDTALRAMLDELLQLHGGRKPANEALFLIKFAFFPDTLQPGPGHKADINKASRYAKLINQALAQDIRPDAFVAFARDHGVQRTAHASRRAKRPRVAKTVHRRRTIYLDPAALSEATILTAAVSPLETWFYSTNVLDQLAGAKQRTKSQPHKITLTMYVNNERAVVTDLTAQAWHGKFPEGAIRVESAARVSPQPPATKKKLSRRCRIRRARRFRCCAAAWGSNAIHERRLATACRWCRLAELRSSPRG
jgi:hypothetical protein